MKKRYWLPALKKIFVDLYFFLPTRLLASQIRRYPLAVLLWIFLFGVVGQYLLVSFGGPYLFLDPDYQGNINFISTFWVGIFLGAFTVSYHLTNYILDGPKFYFLATQRKPFLTFCFNNSLLPGIFWVFYMVNLFHFQSHQKEFFHQSSPWILVLGLFSGGIVWVLIVSGYFQLTNKNAEKILGKRMIEDLSDPLGMARRPFLYKKTTDFYVKTYLSIQLKKIRVHPIDEEDKKRFLKVLSQNHNNALFFQITVFVLLSLLSLFSEISFIQIPAAASYLMLFSFLLMFYGAILFWFRKMGIIVLIILLFFLFWFRDISGWRPTSFAFGLQYPKKEKVAYNYQFIHSQSDSLKIQQSFQEHQSRFFAWKKKTQKQKPNLFIVCSSGGGSRSALWTVSCLQYLDSITQNKFSQHLYLMTGASGGMIGSAYYREMLAQNFTLEQKISSIHKNKVSKDILNRISFSTATQLLTLPLYVEIKNQTYRKERGYHFEHQLVYNTNFWENKTIGDYYLAEKNAQIPMLILTPTIVNDGRKLLISPMNNAIFCERFQLNELYRNECHYIEWKQLFQGHQPDSLLMTSAIRMNATFPYILPNVELPTNPALEIMDAGVTDNFGITTASTFLVRFLQYFKKEFNQIIIIQIRDSKQEEKIEKVDKNSIIEDFLSILSDSYNSISNNGDYTNDMLLEYAKQIMGNQLQMFELQYIPANEYQSASLSFHLTEQEKKDILNALNVTENQKVFLEIKRLLN